MQEGFETKSNYTNPNIQYLFSKNIYEYDIHDAGMNICRYYELLDKKELDKLSHMSKDQRVVRLGNLQKKEEFRDKLSKGFSDIRKEFYEANNLDINDIISVKKDAIFTSKECNATIFGPVEFVVKHIYTSFIRLKKPLELYYNINELDVKGIDDSVLKLHKNGILEFLNKYFRKVETGDIDDVFRLLNREFSKYKGYKQPLEYYREFNSESKYVEKITGDKYKDYWDDDIFKLDISFNIKTLFIPLAQILL